MELTNPAVTDGVQAFVYITVFLIAFVNALLFVNNRKEQKKTGIKEKKL